MTWLYSASPSLFPTATQYNLEEHFNTSLFLLFTDPNGLEGRLNLSRIQGDLSFRSVLQQIYCKYSIATSLAFAAVFGPTRLNPNRFFFYLKALWDYIKWKDSVKEIRDLKQERYAMNLDYKHTAHATKKKWGGESDYLRDPKYILHINDMQVTDLL